MSEQLNVPADSWGDDRSTAPSLRSVPAAGSFADPVPFSAAIAELALSWRDRGVGDSGPLDEIVGGAVGVVPGCEYAALVVYNKCQQLVAQAASGPETAAMIALQNELGEGPCRQTAATNVIIRAANVPTDPRWPRFGPRAVELGIGSMLCTPLTVGRRTYGSLSMASGVPDSFDAESEMLASIFATHAAIALADADRLDTLHQALDTRDLIGQAKGILMGRYGLTADTAFAVLVRESRNANVKLRTVCERLCSTGLLPSGQLQLPT